MRTLHTSTIKEKKYNDIVLERIPILNIDIDPTCTHLAKRWWHKFIFWKKYKYPEMTVYKHGMTLEEFEKEYRDGKTYSD